ncbi:hypothetical protein SCUCBS95973_006369 [Sporothrix curviconia]|uniref:Zinc fyve domain containing protein n=1 Tax=Sporothrix curviconia TaxID=1260050 RepID=A0ABP0C4Q0_9PEZI
MSGPPDRSLLDRLNALKPSTISLDASRQTGSGNTLPLVPGANVTGGASSTSFTSPGTAAALDAAGAPVSREDALAARLKAFRHARDASSSEPRSEEPKYAPPAEAGDPKAPGNICVAPDEASKSDAAQRDEEEEPLYFVDDQDVDDLLLELAEEGFGEEDDDGEDDDDYELLPLPEVPKSLDDESEEGGNGDGDDADHSQQVEDLLKSLAGTKLINEEKTAGHQKGGDSDDSDGEDMDREIRRVLAQAKDEAELARQAGISNDDDANDADDDDFGDADLGTGPRRRNLDKEDASILPGNKKPSTSKADGTDNDNFLGLPAVPTDLIDPPPTNNDDASSDHPMMGLPSVPTKALPKRGDDDDISARLAALRGLQGKAAGLGQTDAFGLPSAPTFRPGEEEGGVLKRGHFGHGRRNYTDDDRKAWCIVCLEDATVRCLGCADNNRGDNDDDDDQNNAYCTGCWQHMHVGPAAGFDARGHKRVPLVR